MRAAGVWLLHFVVLTVGIVIAFHPTLRTGFTYLQTDPGDTLLNHYILEHTWKCVSERDYVGSLWSPPCFHPTTGTLAYSENLLGSAPVYWSLRFVFSELRSFQLWMMMVAGLTYVSMAWTLRQFGIGHWLAALGGLVFAFGLPRMNQLGHQQLLPAFYSPPAVYCTWRLLNEPSLKWLSLTIALVILQLLAGVYLGWFLAFGLTCFFVIHLASDASARQRIGEFLVGQRKSIAAVGAMAFVVLAFMFVPYVTANWGFKRHYKEVALMLPTIEAWMSPGPASWWSAWLPPIQGPANHELHDFPGMVPAVIFLGALVFVLLRRRTTPPVVWVSILTASALILLSLKMGKLSPWRGVYAVVPGANAIRAASRIFTVVELFGLIGGLLALQLGLRRMRVAGVATAAVLLVLGAAEQVQSRMPAFDPAPFYAETDRLANELRGARAGYVELDPDAQFWVSQIAGMWAGMKANVPVVNGYSGRVPRNYPDEKSIWNSAELSAWLPGDVRVVPAKLAQSFPAPIIPDTAPPSIRVLDFRPYRSAERAERQ